MLKCSQYPAGPFPSYNYTHFQCVQYTNAHHTFMDIWYTSSFLLFKFQQQKQATQKFLVAFDKRVKRKKNQQMRALYSNQVEIRFGVRIIYRCKIYLKICNSVFRTRKHFLASRLVACWPLDERQKGLSGWNGHRRSAMRFVFIYIFRLGNRIKPSAVQCWRRWFELVLNPNGREKMKFINILMYTMYMPEIYRINAYYNII